MLLALIITWVIISGLTAAGLILLGVFVYRVIVRTRKGARR